MRRQTRYRPTAGEDARQRIREDTTASEMTGLGADEVQGNKQDEIETTNKIKETTDEVRKRWQVS